MKRLDTTQQGFRTSVLGKHLETLPREGSYADNEYEVGKFGLHRFYHDTHIVLYRTENGVAIDLLASNQHLILGTTNFGDPISDTVWMCIVRNLLPMFGTGFAKDYFVASERLEKKSEDFIEHFKSQINKLFTAEN